MPRKYVCNPKTDRVIEVGGATYKEVSKNAADRRKLERSPKNTSKKKLTPCKSPRRRRKSPKGKKSRGRPRSPVKCGNPKGWSAIKPGGHERPVLLDKCGKKCFLGRDKTFPICAAGSCRRNQKGVSAACIRARQMSSPRSKKVKGRSKAYYNRIAQRALALRNSELRSSGGANPRRYSVTVKPGQAGAALGTCHRNENCLPGLNSAQNIAFSSCKWLSQKTFPRGERYGSWESNDPKGGCVSLKSSGGANPRKYKQNTNLVEKEWGEGGISPRRYHLPRVNTNNISPWRMIHNETSPDSYTYYYSNANTHKLLGPLMAGQLNYTLEQIESYKRSIDKTEEENIDKWESGHYGNNSSGRSTSHSGSWYT